jgi:hypothetical protein
VSRDPGRAGASSERANFLEAHSHRCGTPQNDKHREYGWWWSFSYSFSASARIGQEESQHRDSKTRRGHAPKPRFRKAVQSQDRRQQRPTAQCKNLNKCRFRKIPFDKRRSVTDRLPDAEQQPKKSASRDRHHDECI